MAIMNFVACPLEEGVSPHKPIVPFDGSIVASILDRNDELNTALFYAVNPNTGPLTINPDKEYMIRIPAKNEDEKGAKIQILVRCLESDNIFARTNIEYLQSNMSRLLDFMQDPKNNPDYTCVEKVELRQLIDVLGKWPYTFIEPLGITLKLKFIS